MKARKHTQRKQRSEALKESLLLGQQEDVSVGPDRNAH